MNDTKIDLFRLKVNYNFELCWCICKEDGWNGSGMLNVLIADAHQLLIATKSKYQPS